MHTIWERHQKHYHDLKLALTDKGKFLDTLKKLGHDQEEWVSCKCRYTKGKP